MRKKLDIVNVILIVGAVVGISFLAYPTLSDYYNSFHHSKVIMSYSEKIAKMNDDSYQKILESAKQYNQKVSEIGVRWYLNQNEKALYNQELSFNEQGNMGYIDIPKINTKLSIFHGTEEDILQTSVGHLEGTSLPIGGKSTHSALSGHRGLPSAKLFSDLDKLAIGDIFILHVLNETFTYEVDQIRVVLPNNVSDIKIVEGMDYSTLITCTPYGVNTHRLLVRGHRIKNIDGDARVIADAIQIEPMFITPFLIVPMVLFLILYTLISTTRASRKLRYLKSKNFSILRRKTNPKIAELLKKLM